MILESRVIEARLFGDTIENLTASISGLDVRNEEQPYASCGFPVCPSSSDWEDMKLPPSPDIHLKFLSSSVPIWYTANFDRDTSLYVPLRLNLQGPATCFVWLNGTLMGKYYGNKDGPQNDFYLLDGLVTERDNKLEFLCYDGRCGDEMSGLVLRIREWKVDGWSGNIQEDGKSLLFRTENLKL